MSHPSNQDTFVFGDTGVSVNNPNEFHFDQQNIVEYSGAESIHEFNDLIAGPANSAILIGLLLPAVQKVREAAARHDPDHNNFAVPEAGHDIHHAVWDALLGDQILG